MAASSAAQRAKRQVAEAATETPAADAVPAPSPGTPGGAPAAAAGGTAAGVTRVTTSEGGKSVAQGGVSTTAEGGAGDGASTAVEGGGDLPPRAARCIGLIGHPNAGKTSLLNALVGSKIASVSRTPGHTKHLQALP